MDSEVSAIEDLMREHGLLNRILLIYEEIIDRIRGHRFFDPKLITMSALIIRKFIEDYHEMIEETYIFPVLIKHKIETGMVEELLMQHKLGRVLTDFILQSCQLKMTPKIANKLVLYMTSFVKMYRYHESREDTIIFQAFKNVIPMTEYQRLGELFDVMEEEHLGSNGFEKILKIVESMEKRLGINDLKKITSQVESIIFL